MTLLLVDLRLAWLNLLQHRRRTVLLGTAIATVTCLFVLLASLAAGIERTLLNSVATLSAGHINVGGYFKLSQGRVAPLVMDYEKVAAVVRREVPELEYLVGRGRGGGKIVADGVSLETGLVGVELAKEPELGRLLTIKQGNIDGLLQSNTLLLFEQQAKTLQVGVGDAVTIVSQTSRGAANTIDCRVVAIARDVGLLSSWLAFTSAHSLRGLLQLRSDVTGVLQLHLKPGHAEELPGIAARLRDALASAGYRVMKAHPRPFFEKLEEVTKMGWTGQKLDVSTWQDEMSFLTGSLTALRAAGALLIGVLLGITVAGIMNSLWIATRERTREIGTLRALGMQRGAVARVFLLEAGLLGFLAASAGVLLGFASAWGINLGRVQVPLSVQLFVMRDTLNLALLPSTALLAVGLMTLTASVAALYPALRAASLEPANAMLHFD